MKPSETIMFKFVTNYITRVSTHSQIYIAEKLLDLQICDENEISIIFGMTNSEWLSKKEFFFLADLS